MVSSQLISYIKTQLSAGSSQESLRATLVQSGYQPNDIEEGFRLAGQAPQGLTTPTPQTPQGAVYSDAMPRRSGRNMFLFILIPLLVLLILGGAGGYAYYEFVYNAPDKVVARMVKKMEDVKTTVYSSETKLTAKTEEISLPSLPTNLDDEGENSLPGRSLGPIEADFALTVNGATDFADIEHSRGYYGANIEANARMSGTNFGVTVAFESIYIGDDIYIEITQFPGMGFLDPNMFTNQWIRINVKELEKLNKQFGVEERGEDVSIDAKEKIKSLIKNPMLLTITETLESEKIANVDTFHYGFTINKDQLRKTIEEIYIVLNRENFVTEDAVDFGKQLEEFFATLTFQQGEMWIGKSDNYLYKIALVASMATSENLRVSGTLSFTTTLKDHNKPVVVAAPAQYKKLEEILGPLMGSYPINYPSGDGGQPVNPLISPYDRGVLGEATSSGTLPQQILQNLFSVPD